MPKVNLKSFLERDKKDVVRENKGYDIMLSNEVGSWPKAAPNPLPNLDNTAHQIAEAGSKPQESNWVHARSLSLLLSLVLLTSLRSRFRCSLQARRSECF